MSQRVLLVLLLSFVICLIVGTLYLLYALIVPEPSLTLSVSGLPITAQAGKDISFSVQAPPGTRVSYTLIHARTRESFGSGLLQDRTTLRVPADALEGEYLLLIEGTLNGVTSNLEKSFMVTKQGAQGKPVSLSSCPAGCNDFNVCTADSCVNGVCQFTQIVPCCGNANCERGETASSCPDDCAPRLPTQEQSVSALIEQSTGLAASQPLQAAQLCQTLTRQADSDTCLSNAAKASGVSGLCGQIREPLERDLCYMDFALKRQQFEVCERILDRHLKAGCIHIQRS